jgi:hypothetical protein
MYIPFEVSGSETVILGGRIQASEPSFSAPDRFCAASLAVQQKVS